MKDALIDLALITVRAAFVIAVIAHIIALWGEPSEIIGTAITNIRN